MNRAIATYLLEELEIEGDNFGASLDALQDTDDDVYASVRQAAAKRGLLYISAYDMPKDKMDNSYYMALLINEKGQGRLYAGCKDDQNPKSLISYWIRDKRKVGNDRRAYSIPAALTLFAEAAEKLERREPRTARLMCEQLADVFRCVEKASNVTLPQETIKRIRRILKANPSGAPQVT